MHHPFFGPIICNEGKTIYTCTEALLPLLLLAETALMGRAGVGFGKAGDGLSCFLQHRSVPVGMHAKRSRRAVLCHPTSHHPPWQGGRLVLWGNDATTSSAVRARQPGSSREVTWRLGPFFQAAAAASTAAGAQEAPPSSQWLRSTGAAVAFQPISERAWLKGRCAQFTCRTPASPESAASAPQRRRSIAAASPMRALTSPFRTEGGSQGAAFKRRQR